MTIIKVPVTVRQDLHVLANDGDEVADKFLAESLELN